jgi:hypothetical protein
MIPARPQDVAHAFFLADIRRADELDFEPGLRSQAFGVLANPVAIGLGPFRIVEDADAVGVEIVRHALGKADLRNGAGDDDAVVTGKGARDLVGMPGKKRVRDCSPCRDRFHSRHSSGAS